MSFDDDMRNRFANQEPTILNLDAGAAAAAGSARRRTAAVRGLAAIALVAVVGLGAITLTTGGTDLTDVATESPELDESVDDGSDNQDDDGVSEETSDRGEEIAEATEESVDETDEGLTTPAPDEPEETEATEVEVLEEPISTLGDDTVFQVTNVASDDVLNARAGAGVEFDVTGVFFPDSTGIVRTDAESVFVGESEWIEVYGSVSGGRAWVNSSFLAAMDVIDDQSCVFDTGTAPPTTTFQNVDGSADSDALIVSVLGTYRYGSCIRTVIQGLDGFSSSNDPADPVTALPNDISVAVDGTTISINFGTSIIGSDQAQARFAQPGPSDPGGVTSSTFLFRPQGADAPFSGIIYGPNTQVHATFDNSTGRVIIDFADAGEANTVSGPLLDEGSVVFTELTRTGTTVNFTGFARPFEANLVVEVLENDVPIDVTWTGGFITEPSSSNGVMTTDWSSGWGVFDFSIDVDSEVQIDDVVVRFDPSGGAADDPQFVDVRLAVHIG